MISINNNMGGMRSHDALQQSHRVLQTALERLSTGIRINRAEDDAAGIMVRDRFQAQVNGFEEGIRNIQTAQGMIQVAEQGLNKITDALQQMRALAVRAADDNLTDEDRGRIQNQVKGLLREVNERAQRTTYNGKNLLDGSIADPHNARDGVGKLQSNSFLASGNTLLNGVSTTGNAATTASAISQGSYEVKLVYNANKRDHAVATTSTVLGGKADSNFAYLNTSQGNGATFTRSETVYDKSGNAHDVNITFTYDLANTEWDFVANSGAGGDWTSPLNISGSVDFDSNGNFLALSNSAGTTTNTQVGSKVNATIADGTTSGQSWTIDFGKIKQNAQSPAVNTPNATANGTTGGAQTTTANATGTLDASAAAGSSNSFSSTQGWTDRTGVSHAITYTFHKTINQTGGSANADTWSLTLSGFNPAGAWSGAVDNATVSVEFDSAGNISKVNGQSGASYTVNVADGTATGQDVVVNLSGVTNGAAAAMAATANGNAIAPTFTAVAAQVGGVSTPQPRSTTVTNSGNVDSTAAAGPLPAFTVPTIHDRLGVAHTFDITLTKTVNNAGDNDTYTYVISNLTGAGAWTGAINSGANGTLVFNTDGTLNVGGSTIPTLNIEDGTGTDQNITVNFSAMINDRAAVALTSTADGSAVAGNPTLNITPAAEFLQSGAVTQTFVGLQVFDNTGAAHNVDVNFTKTVDAAGRGDTYSYTLTATDVGGFTNGDWTGLVGTTNTGLITFNADGTLAANPPNLQINSTSLADVQSINLNFMATVFNRASVPTAAAGVASGGSATAPSPTTASNYSGALDMNALVGSSVTTNVDTWFDRISGNTGHNTSVTFTKTGIHSWSYQVNGLTTAAGGWTGGAPTGLTAGTLNFNDLGQLTLVNGAAPAPVNITVADDITASDQPVALSFAGMTEGAGYTTLSTLASGTRLVDGAGPTTIQLNNIIDKTGTHSVSGASLTFTQVGTSNSWNYQVNAPTTSGFTGNVIGGSGTVNFSEDGDLLGPLSFVATLDDGTPEGQTITYNMVPTAPGAIPLKMGRASDFSGSTSDGSAGTGDTQVDAVIFYSGSGVENDTRPIFTLEGVSQGAKTYNGGGISFTVNQATSLDAGLTAFVKAYTYVSGTFTDDSLQFQVGPDEGMVTRLGIRKMDVQSIFRGGNDSYDYKDIKLDTQLQAQDLIGALDDAIDYVSEENLKVGNFQNHMTRTLELARQQQTSITGALSNLNDADMALEATNQSKRSILVQSGTAMVAQANTQGQFLLQLLR